MLSKHFFDDLRNQWACLKSFKIQQKTLSESLNIFEQNSIEQRKSMRIAFDAIAASQTLVVFKLNFLRFLKFYFTTDKSLALFCSHFRHKIIKCCKKKTLQLPRLKIALGPAKFAQTLAFMNYNKLILDLLATAVSTTREIIITTTITNNFIDSQAEVKAQLKKREKREKNIFRTVAFRLAE